MKQINVLLYVVTLFFTISTLLTTANAGETGKETTAIKESEVTRFLPENLPEEQKWLEVYGVVPLKLKRLDVNEYKIVARQFFVYSEKILKPEFIPSQDFVTKNLILVPASSFPNHDEDIAYLRYSINGKNCLIAQTEVKDKGKVFLFVQDSGDEMLLGKGDGIENQLEELQRLTLQGWNCFVFSKTRLDRMRAWGGPKADEWFKEFKNKPPKPTEPSIPFEEVAEALEELPLEKRLKLYREYKRMELHRKRTKALEIIKEASESSYTDKDRLKDDAEYDNKVRAAIKVIGEDRRFFYELTGYLRLRKLWNERYERLSAGERIETEAEFHYYGDLLISDARIKMEEDKQQE